MQREFKIGWTLTGLSTLRLTINDWFSSYHMTVESRGNGKIAHGCSKTRILYVPAMGPDCRVEKDQFHSGFISSANDPDFGNHGMGAFTWPPLRV